MSHAVTTADETSPTPPPPEPEAAPAAEAPAAEAPPAEAPFAPFPEAPAAPRGLWARVTWLSEGAFGLGALWVALAIAAMIPVLQFVTLGYLLEAEGRVAREGSLRAGFPGVRRLARIGSAVLGTLLISIPWLVVRGYAQDAALFPASSAAATLRGWTTGLFLLTALQAGLAIARGGRLRYFFSPLNALWLVKHGVAPAAAWARCRAFVAELALGHLLELGVKGFVAALLWLLLPSLLLAAGSRAPAASVLGGLLLTVILPWLVMGQARLARENRFGAAFELRAIRRELARAPLSALVALVLTLGLALPLYLWKIEPLDRDARWLPALFFLAALFPGRLAAGWAAWRARREGRARWFVRWPLAWLMLPASGFYVFAVFFSQYFDWNGALGAFTHHAFLLPVAFY
ncbi:MAG: DUF4013 domain-containing protein [Planctomycetota bacterium]